MTSERLPAVPANHMGRRLDTPYVYTGHRPKWFSRACSAWLSLTMPGGPRIEKLHGAQYRLASRRWLSPVGQEIGGRDTGGAMRV